MKKTILFLLGVLMLNTHAFTQKVDSMAANATNQIAQTAQTAMTWFEKLLILSPLFLTVFVFLILVKVFKSIDFSLKGALTEMPSDSLIKAVLGDRTVTKENVENLEKFSSSRLIALLTSLCVMSITVCLVCFYMYWYLKDGVNPPKLDGITSVLLTLGLGIVPYGMNKISEAFK